MDEKECAEDEEQKDRKPGPWILNDDAELALHCLLLGSL